MYWWLSWSGRGSVFLSLLPVVRPIVLFLLKRRMVELVELIPEVFTELVQTEVIIHRKVMEGVPLKDPDSILRLSFYTLDALLWSE